MKHYNKYTLKYAKGLEMEKSVFVAFFFQIKPWNHCLNFTDTSPKETSHLETEEKQTEHSIRKCKQTYLYISI